MKLKLKKLTIESMGISILLATMLTCVIAILSIMGWGMLWGVLVAVLYPVAEAGRKFYQEHKCRHMTEFFEILADKTIDDGKEEEETISGSIDPYW